MVLQKLDMPQYAAKLVWEKFNHLNGPEKLEQVLAQGFPNLEEAIEIGGETLSFSRPPEPAKEILKQVAQRLSEIQDIDAITEDQAMDVLDVVIDSMQEIFHLGGFGEQSPVEEKKDT